MSCHANSARIKMFTFRRASSMHKPLKSIPCKKWSRTNWLNEFCRFPKYWPIICFDNPFRVSRKCATLEASSCWWFFCASAGDPFNDLPDVIIPDGASNPLPSCPLPPGRRCCTGPAGTAAAVKLRILLPFPASDEARLLLLPLLAFSWFVSLARLLLLPLLVVSGPAVIPMNPIWISSWIPRCDTKERTGRQIWEEKRVWETNHVFRERTHVVQ